MRVLALTAILVLAGTGAQAQGAFGGGTLAPLPAPTPAPAPQPEPEPAEPQPSAGSAFDQGSFPTVTPEPQPQPAPQPEPQPVVEVPPADIPSIGADNPPSIVAALQSLGYRAEYTPSESTGRPRIKSAVSGVNYSIWFYGCYDDMTGCQRLLFTAGFNLNDGTTYDLINEWNGGKVFGRAHLDEDYDPYFEMTIVRGLGLTTRDIEDIVEVWSDALVGFTDLIGFQR